MDIKKLLQAAQQFELRAKNSGKIGNNFSIDEILDIEKKLNIKFPNWYAELFSKTNIAGIICSYHFQKSHNQWQYYQMQLSTTGDIERESMHAFPGCQLIKHGYLCFGIGEFGSDNFFISLNEEPVIKLIYHDIDCSNQETIETESETIAIDLLDFFQNAHV
jgi:hypothetical protein